MTNFGWRSGETTKNDIVDECLITKTFKPNNKINGKNQIL